MNIQVQLCGLVILIFLLLLYNSSKKIGLESEKIFNRTLFLTIICISLDVLSIVVITYMDKLPIWLVKGICKSYLVSMVWVGWIYFCYVMLDLNSDYKWHNRTKLIMSIVTIIESITIFLLKIDIVIDGKNVYTENWAVYITYAFTIFYILSALSVAIFILVKMNSRRGMAMLLTTITWIIAAIIQAFNNEILLVGFAMCVGIMIVFIVLDNPDIYLDRELSCFNAYALSNYIDMKIFRKRSYSLIDISVRDLKALEDKHIDVAQATKKFISLINSNKEIKIFKNLSTGLIITADDIEKLDSIINLFYKFISKYPGSSQSLLLFTVKDAEQFKTADELYKFLTYVKSKNEKLTSTIVHTSNNTIAKYKEFLAIQEEIKEALKEDRIEVYYQPIHEISIDKTTSCEALARIKRKDGSLLSPGIFIPVAEDTGLIKSIGEVVFEKVCRFLKDSKAIDLGIDKIHVNLSAVQCDDSQTSSLLINIIDKIGLDPKYITLEITESAVSSNKEALLENMNTLISHGFSFSLDDFGKGESNLMYIVELPVDSLKIDMDLSKLFFINSKAKVVVRSIVNMASMINIPIVSEGIETDFEVKQISKEGITHIQGYYFSKPLPESEFIEYLKDAKINTKIPTTIIMNKDDSDNFVDKIKINGNHILLVEDNEINAEIASDILEMNGFIVDRASDGVYALEIMSKAQSDDYNLILMDIRMPIMDGFECARRIRALSNKKVANIPIIALSAMDSKELQKQSLKTGITKCLNKPFEFKDFDKLIEYEAK